MTNLLVRLARTSQSVVMYLDGHGERNHEYERDAATTRRARCVTGRPELQIIVVWHQFNMQPSGPDHHRG